MWTDGAYYPATIVSFDRDRDIVVVKYECDWSQAEVALGLVRPAFAPCPRRAIPQTGTSRSRTSLCCSFPIQGEITFLYSAPSRDDALRALRLCITGSPARVCCRTR